MRPIAMDAIRVVIRNGNGSLQRKTNSVRKHSDHGASRGYGQAGVRFFRTLLGLKLSCSPLCNVYLRSCIYRCHRS